MKPKPEQQQDQQQQAPAPSSAPSTNGEPPKPARKHSATYSRDKRKGGYLVRVEGPDAAKFSGRKVPVTLRDKSEHVEELDALIWTGLDEESGKPVALYTFKPEERKATETEF